METTIKVNVITSSDPINFEVSEESILLYKDIINYVRAKYTQNFKSIIATYGEYSSLCYDSSIEKYLHGPRVEITYKWSNGEVEKIRCYIGRSTGWLPVYLEIKTKRSAGGGPLMTKFIDKIELLKTKAAHKSC